MGVEGKYIDNDVVKEGEYEKKDMGTTVTKYHHVVQRQGKTKLEQGQNTNCEWSRRQAKR